MTHQSDCESNPVRPDGIQPGAQKDVIRLGDLFEHQRSGWKFVCVGVTRRQRTDDAFPYLVVELEPYPDPRAASVAESYGHVTHQPPVKRTPLAGSGLDFRTINSLLFEGIEYFEDAQQMADRELLKILNFDPASLARLRAWVPSGA